MLQLQDVLLKLRELLHDLRILEQLFVSALNHQITHFCIRFVSDSRSDSFTIEVVELEALELGLTLSLHLGL